MNEPRRKRTLQTAKNSYLTINKNGQQVFDGLVEFLIAEQSQRKRLKICSKNIWEIRVKLPNKEIATSTTIVDSANDEHMQD